MSNRNVNILLGNVQSRHILHQLSNGRRKRVKIIFALASLPLFLFPKSHFFFKKKWDFFFYCKRHNLKKLMNGTMVV